MKNTTPHYGLHILKVIAIFFQIEVHSYSWITRALTWPADNTTSPFYTQLLLLKGGFSMLVSITAAAVLRMSFPMLSSQSRLSSNVDVKPFYSAAFYLALLESIKQVCIYGWGAFFSWDALHLIALTIIIIVWVSQYSLFLLWPLALCVFGLTPFLLQLVEPSDKLFRPVPPHLIPPPPYNSLAYAYMLVWTLIMAWLIYKYTASSMVDRVHQKRGVFFLAILWLAGIWAASTLSTPGDQHYQLQQLGLGMLIGDISGLHIWGFFPWGAMIIIGFLVYDLILRFKGRPSLLWLFTLTGLAMLAMFFLFFSDGAINNCSAHAITGGFNATCFNRTPSQALLATGLFLVSVPLCILGEKWGLENSLVRSISRSILWIYVFQTSVMVWFSGWWVRVILKDKVIPENISIEVFTYISIAICIGIGIFIDRFLPKITIKLKKVENPSGPS